MPLNKVFPIQRSVLLVNYGRHTLKQEARQTRHIVAGQEVFNGCHGCQRQSATCCHLRFKFATVSSLCFTASNCLSINYVKRQRLL